MVCDKVSDVRLQFDRDGGNSKRFQAVIHYTIGKESGNMLMEWIPGED